MNRQPSTPPPSGNGEEITSFQTPSVRKDSSHSHILKSKKDHKLLFTPQTPCLPNRSNEYQFPMSPQTSKKTDNYIDLFPKSRSTDALRTPELTPRNQNRKIDALEGNSRTSAPLFQHSKVQDESHRLLDFSKGFKMESSDELLSASSSEETDEESKMKINDLSNQIAKSIPSLQSPRTPPNQIMDDAYLEQKFGIEKCEFTELENLKETFDDLNRNRRTTQNPFASGYRIDKNKKKPDYSRLESEIELVYHATGQKFYVKMPESSQKIKPKKLNFDDIETDMYSPENLKTPGPSQSRQNVMSIKGLLNDDNELKRMAYLEEDKEDIKYGVKREPVRNPFITKRVVSPPPFSTFHDKGENVNSISKNNNLSRVEGVRRRCLNSSFQSRSDQGDNASVMNSIEYINMTTGERVVKNMDEDQREIKPKKLTFD